MATIAYERAANARAQAEGYANAASKEMHANTQSKAAGFPNAVAAEIDANKRAQAAGFRNAAEQEMDANRRAQAAGWQNAALQEMDANRRARMAGFENAALQESLGASIYSNAPFAQQPPSWLQQGGGLISAAEQGYGAGALPWNDLFNASNLSAASSQSPWSVPRYPMNFNFNPQNWGWGQPFLGVNPKNSWLLGV